MPNSSAAKKALKKSEAQKKINKSKIKQVKTFKKKFELSITNDKENSQEIFQQTQSLIAKAAKKKIITKGRRDRLISNMAKKISKAS